MAAAGEEGADGLKRVAVDFGERPRAVGGAGVVATVQIVVLRQALPQRAKDSKTAEARVEYAYRPGLPR